MSMDMRHPHNMRYTMLSMKRELGVNHWMVMKQRLAMVRKNRDTFWGVRMKPLKKREP